MAPSLRRPGSPIRVLIIAADNMMGELLTGAFNQGRNDFVLATLVGSWHAVVGKLRSYETDVAVISAELQDGPLAGLNVLQSLQNSATGRFRYALANCYARMRGKRFS